MQANPSDARRPQRQDGRLAHLDRAIEKILARSVDIDVPPDIPRTIRIEAEVATQHILVRVVVVLPSAGTRLKTQQPELRITGAGSCAVPMLRATCGIQLPTSCGCSAYFVTVALAY